MANSLDTSTVGTTYEYKTVTGGPQNPAFTRDTYASFGWVEDGQTPASITGGIVFSLKRDRHIKNRSLVTELQRKAESAMTDIDHLERSKTATATFTAFAIGIIGTAFLAGSVFLFEDRVWAPSVILGVFGLACWVIPRFAYTTIRRHSTARVTPLIDQQRDVIYDACEQAQQLLA